MKALSVGLPGAEVECERGRPDGGIVNLSRGGILLPSVARRFGAEKSSARL